jgi:hypothetical protein
MIYTTPSDQLQRAKSLLESFKPPKYHKPYQPEILNKINDFISSSLSHHSKITFYRVDLRFPDTCNPYPSQIIDAPTHFVRNDSSVISRFQDALKWRLNKHIKQYSKSLTVIHTLWVRELSQSAGYHYHLIIALNANSFFGFGNYDNEETLANMIQTAWNSALGIGNEPPYFVYFSNIHFIDLSLTDKVLKAELKDTYNHFSYLAKTATKPQYDGKRNFGCSQLDNAYWSLMVKDIKRKGA